MLKYTWSHELKLGDNCVKVGKGVTVDFKGEFSDLHVKGTVIKCLLFFFLASLDALQLIMNCLVNSLISLPSRTATKIKTYIKQTNI